MNAVDMLKQDHRSISKLFAQYDRMPADDLSGRHETVQKIVHALRVHAAIEEESFYPRVEAQAKQDGAPEVAEEACESAEEHEAINTLLGEIEAMRADDAALAPKMGMLKKTMRAHFREEEQDLLSVIEKKLDGDDLESLGQQLQHDRDAVEAGETLKHSGATVH